MSVYFTAFVFTKKTHLTQTLNLLHFKHAKPTVVSDICLGYAMLYIIIIIILPTLQMEMSQSGWVSSPFHLAVLVYLFVICVALTNQSFRSQIRWLQWTWEDLRFCGLIYVPRTGGICFVIRLWGTIHVQPLEQLVIPDLCFWNYKRKLSRTDVVSPRVALNKILTV